MPNVTNLEVKLQKGTTDTYFAIWDFKETTKKVTTTPATTGIGVGKYVTIKPGATYYNGVSIPSWVMSDTWKIIQITDDRAVLGPNKSGSNDICSPINVAYLIGEDSNPGSTETEIIKTNYLDHYEVIWYYATGDGISFEGSHSDVKIKQSTYTPPSNATKLRVKIKPVSKTHKVNDEDVAYWTGSWVNSSIYAIKSNPPEKPNAPTVEVNKFKLTASLENISDPRTDRILFDVYKGNKRFQVTVVKVTTARASATWTISAGDDYRVRCRGCNLYGSDKIYRPWSEYSESVGTIPEAPKKIITLKALSETAVAIDWENVKNATSYEVQYTKNKSYFDSNPSEVKSHTVESVVGHAEITGLESGEEYFFRVRAVNEAGNSSWGEIKSIKIGEAPAAPTTWSSTTTVITGEELLLYWVHNSEDGSKETYAQVEITIGSKTNTYTIKNTNTDDEKNKTSFYRVNTTAYTEGTKIKWRVRTAGITGSYGPWSVQRIVDIYAPVTLQLEVTDVKGADLSTLTTFPFYVKAIAGPRTQSPVGYHLSITANETYETVDNVGNPMIINEGESVFSRYFDTSEVLIVELSANNINLDNGISYTITCAVSMNSGLRTESYTTFKVRWKDIEYEPDAEIGVDEDSCTAYISPYCIDEKHNAIPDLLLSVYRREFDGSFTEIATGIKTTSNTYVTDPHPALDYARYRIVATSKSTGAVSYYDPPGYPLGCKSIIIQWSEEWDNFDYTEDEGVVDGLEKQPTAGSFLRLPYNIDVTEGNSPDVALVKYVGREHPVSYYGTHLGTSATWNVEIPIDDKETLYALRRLSRWMGDVYVREPSGVGYWANVTVSMSQKHCSLTIPVTIDITRVEGGV